MNESGKDWQESFMLKAKMFWALGLSLAVGLMCDVASRKARADVFDLSSSNISIPSATPYATVTVSSPGSGQIEFVVQATTSTDKVGELFFDSNVSLTGITYNEYDGSGTGGTELVSNGT